MKRFGLIGHPLGHSLSPALFEAAYGGRYPYDLIDGPDFDAAYSRFLESYDGVNVTMPFKEQAFLKADIASPECRAIGAANILVKDGNGLVHAHNSDFLAVKALIPDDAETVLIVGFGGAGRAAYEAARSLGKDVTVVNRTKYFEEIVDFDVIIGKHYSIIVDTLPVPAPQLGLVESDYFLEANYLDPAYSGRKGYIPGTQWLKMQAMKGYEILVGEAPEKEKIINLHIGSTTYINL